MDSMNIYLLLAFILGYFANSIIKQMCGQNIEGFDEPDESDYCDPSPPKICEITEGDNPITCETDSDCLCNKEIPGKRTSCKKALAFARRDGQDTTSITIGPCIPGPQPMCPGDIPCPDCGTDRCLCPSPPPSEEIFHGQPRCVPGQKCGDGSECPPNGLCPVPCAGLEDHIDESRISCNEGTVLKEGAFYNTSSPQEQQDSCCVDSCTSVVGDKGERCVPGAKLVENHNTIYPKGYGVNGGCCEYLDISQMNGSSLYNKLNSEDYKCGESGEQCIECGEGESDQKTSEECPVTQEKYSLNDEAWKRHLRKYYPDETGNYGILCGVNNTWTTYTPPDPDKWCLPWDYDCQSGTFGKEQKIFDPKGKKCAISQ